MGNQRNINGHKSLFQYKTGYTHLQRQEQREKPTTL